MPWTGAHTAAFLGWEARGQEGLGPCLWFCPQGSAGTGMTLGTWAQGGQEG